MLGILSLCGVIFSENIQYSSNDLYLEYVKFIDATNELREKEGKEPIDPLYTQKEIYIASWIMRFLVFMVLPASLYIYRANLLHFKAFKSVKKHNINRKGLAYNPKL